MRQGSHKVVVNLRLRFGNGGQTVRGHTVVVGSFNRAAQIKQLRQCLAKQDVTVHSLWRFASKLVCVLCIAIRAS